MGRRSAGCYAAALFEVQREGFAMTNALQPLPAARQVDSLLDAARTLLLNAEETLDI